MGFDVPRVTVTAASQTKKKTSQVQVFSPPRLLRTLNAQPSQPHGREPRVKDTKEIERPSGVQGLC